jgi:hypothetical protein
MDYSASLVLTHQLALKGDILIHGLEQLSLARPAASLLHSILRWYSRRRSTRLYPRQIHRLCTNCSHVPPYPRTRAHRVRTYPDGLGPLCPSSRWYRPYNCTFLVPCMYNSFQSPPFVKVVVHTHKSQSLTNLRPCLWQGRRGLNRQYGLKHYCL